MPLTLAQVLAALERSPATLAAAVEETAGAPPRRAARLVADFQSLWPAPLYACLLRQDGNYAWSVLREDGAAPPDDQLLGELQGWLHGKATAAPVTRLAL